MTIIRAYRSLTIREKAGNKTVCTICHYTVSELEFKTNT